MLRRLFILLLLLGVAGGGSYAVWRMFQVQPPLLRAERLFAEKDVFGAQVLLRRVIRTEPRNTEAHLWLARTQLATADWLSAEKEARTLRALGYDRTVAIPMLVRAYAMQKRYQEILTEVPAVAVRPEEQAMNLALRSVAYLGLDDLAQAQALVDAAARLAPGEFLVHLQKARVALGKKDGLAGLAEVDAALRLRPDSTEALVAKSELLSLRWDTTGALEQLDRAVEVAPLSQDLRMARAGLLLSLGLNQQAQLDVNAVYDVTSSNATALYYNAILMLRSGQFADANVEFDKLGPLIEQFPKTLYYKAQIALELGNRQSALESLDRFLKAQPGDPEGLRLEAQVELQSARPDRALALLAPATTPNSHDAGSIDLQGRAYFMLGRMPEAIESFRRATAMAPNNRDFSAHLAAAQTQFGVTLAPGEGAAETTP